MNDDVSVLVCSEEEFRRGGAIGVFFPYHLTALLVVLFALDVVDGLDIGGRWLTTMAL
jgi:hypothetical protein